MEEFEESAESHRYGLSIPDDVAPVRWVQLLEDFFGSRGPKEDAKQLILLHMHGVTRMEQALFRQLATGMNNIGATVGHLRGLHHKDPRTSPCEACNRETTSRFIVRKTCHASSASGKRKTHNSEAQLTIRREIGARLHEEEPALCGKPRKEHGQYEARVRVALDHYLMGDITALLCYRFLTAPDQQRATYIEVIISRI